MNAAFSNEYLDFASLHLGRGFRHFASRLRPHLATRTSIPLRFISVVAFATYTKKRKGLLECKHSYVLSSFLHALLNA